MVDFTVFKGGKAGVHEATSTRNVKRGEVVDQDMALGHEGTGTVQDVGDEVTLFKKGDRVGWGYQHDACGHCKQCLRGAETFCAERKVYGYDDLDQGSMASHAVWKEAFLFKIPDRISLENAAPLMCGGATVFNALQLHGVKSTDRVGVIGVGGLGHLAIQFAAAMGCDVVVFSGTDSKKDEATKLGAREFIVAKGQKELKLSKQVDHLLVTTASQPDWSLYLPIMALSGTIYPLSISSDDLKMPYMGILMSGLKIQGSLWAAREIHREMLEFAAAHDIKPIIQTFPLNTAGINDAFTTLETGAMRYRGVLVA